MLRSILPVTPELEAAIQAGILADEAIKKDIEQIARQNKEAAEKRQQENNAFFFALDYWAMVNYDELLYLIQQIHKEIEKRKALEEQLLARKRDVDQQSQHLSPPPKETYPATVLTNAEKQLADIWKLTDAFIKADTHYHHAYAAFTQQLAQHHQTIAPQMQQLAVHTVAKMTSPLTIPAVQQALQAHPERKASAAVVHHEVMEKIQDQLAHQASAGDIFRVAQPVLQYHYSAARNEGKSHEEAAEAVQQKMDARQKLNVAIICAGGICRLVRHVRPEANDNVRTTIDHVEKDQKPVLDQHLIEKNRLSNEFMAIMMEVLKTNHIRESIAKELSTALEAGDLQAVKHLLPGSSQDKVQALEKMLEKMRQKGMSLRLER